MIVGSARRVIFVSLMGATILAGGGCGKGSEVKAIENVLRVDSQTASGLEGVEPREAFRVVVQRMKAIDLRGCPDDFRAAYFRHVCAWEDAQYFVENEVPQSLVESVIVGFLNGLSGQLDGGYGELSRRGKVLDDAIRSTFREVQAVAIEHGASLN